MELMEEETRRAVEDAIISAHLKLAYKIIKMAIRDISYRPAEAWAFLHSEGFPWFLWVIGCEPEDVEDIAGRIAMRAFGL